MSKSGQPIDIAAGFTVVFLLIGVAGLFRSSEPTIPTPSFDPGPGLPDVAKLSPVWKEQRDTLQQFPLDDEAQRAIKVFLNFGKIDAMTGGVVKNPVHIEASQEVLDAMNRYWFQRGEDAYRALGMRMADRFIENVLLVLNKAKEAGVPAQTWLGQRPNHALTQSFYAHTGMFLGRALRMGVINEKNQLLGANTALLRLLFNLHWAGFVTSIKDYVWLMHIEELRALWRWRIHGDRSLSMAIRMEVSGWLRKIEPGYPAFEVLGALYAKRGYYRAALAMYREALLDSPFDEGLQNNLHFLVMQLNQSQ
jgi:tetratricopeptide (TPR) repeat protein